MLRGFWKLTWVETKIFIREPMGVVGTLGVPLLLFVVLGRMFGASRPDAAMLQQAKAFSVPILSAILIALNAVTSLVAIMSIYREGGILKRLRTTPLSPLTILSAHVFVKLIFTVVSLLLLVAAGRRLFPGAMDVPLISFAAALLLSTISILSLGFIIAAIVPTARFAQPVSAAVLSDDRAVGLVLSGRAPPAWISCAGRGTAHHACRGADAGCVGWIGVGGSLDECAGARRSVRCLFGALNKDLPMGVRSAREHHQD